MLFFHGILHDIYNQWQHLLKLAIFLWKSLKKIFDLLKVTSSLPWLGISKRTCNEHFARKLCTTFISYYFQHITKSVHDGSPRHLHCCQFSNMLPWNTIIFLKKILLYFFLKRLHGNVWWHIENDTNMYLFHWKCMVEHTVLNLVMNW